MCTPLIQDNFSGSNIDGLVLKPLISNNFEISKIITSDEDQLLHSKRLEEIEEKIGKKTLWNT